MIIYFVKISHFMSVKDHQVSMVQSPNTKTRVSRTPGLLISKYKNVSNDSAGTLRQHGRPDTQPVFLHSAVKKTLSQQAMQNAAL